MLGRCSSSCGVFLESVGGLRSFWFEGCGVLVDYGWKERREA